MPAVRRRARRRQSNDDGNDNAEEEQQVILPVLQPASSSTTAPPSPARGDFYARVYEAVRQCPHGQVTTYGTIATLIGHPKHSRLVGQALRDLPRRFALPTRLRQAHAPVAGTSSAGTFVDDASSSNLNARGADQDDDADDDEDDEEVQQEEEEDNPDWVPWHRVVGSSGTISVRGNTTAMRTQGDWLRAEGIIVGNDAEAAAAGDAAGGAGAGAGAADYFGLAGRAQSGGKVRHFASLKWTGPLA